MKPRTILFVSHASLLYGAERSLQSLVSGMKEQGKFHPVVLCPGKGPLTTLLKQSGIPVIVHSYSPWVGGRKAGYLPKLLHNVIAFLTLLPRVRSIKPSLIYTNTLVMPIGIFLALASRLPHLFHAREFLREGVGAEFHFGLSLSMRLIAKSALIICNSAAVKEKLGRTLPPEKLLTVHNGIDVPPPPYASGRDKFAHCVAESHPAKLYIVGGIYAAKGHADALKALAVLLEKGVHVELNVVGSGYDRDVTELKELARELSVEGAVRWHGYVEDTRSCYADAAVLLVCSRCEAFGRVAVEALGAGTPVIGTRSGGLPEILDFEPSRLLYSPGDHSDLADKIESLLKDEELYVKCADNGPLVARERFGLSRYIEEVSNAVEGVLPG